MKLSFNIRLVLLMLLTGLIVLPASGAVAAPRGAAVTSTTAATTTAAKAKPLPLCRKLWYSRVMGQRPTYSTGLKSYPVRQFTCRAYWLAGADQNFVPQAVAVSGPTAYVSGYTWPSDTKHNRCRIEKIDLLTGAVLADQTLIAGFQSDSDASGSATTNYQQCRHGGGMALDSHGLWVSEAGRVWLLDPSKLGAVPDDPTYPVIRWWGLPKAPVRASTIVLGNQALGVGYYTGNASKSKLSWFGIGHMMTPGAQTLTAHPVDPVTDVGFYRQQQLPTRTQGLYWWKGHGGIWSTRSYGACSRIVAPGGRQFGAIPGLEGIQVSSDGFRTYLMSENASKPFTRKGERLVPFLTQVPTKKLLKLHGAGHCG